MAVAGEEEAAVVELHSWLDDWQNFSHLAIAAAAAALGQTAAQPPASGVAAVDR
jgi:enamine deaminase RidA (YjgF/YER057c/UK114 family)